MKTLMITAVAALLLGATLLASKHQITTCSSDGKVVTLKFTIHDQAAKTHDILAHMTGAFKTMGAFTAEEILHGGLKFWSLIHPEDYEGTDIDEEPSVTGTCSTK